ncbi:acyltransferase family protein [Staphylococcus nepalensis]|uniref:acyltransferase family protein n=1 Tax=Staphylococcus nepalensis TaxID=214473 RepID=UPI001A98902D|nr:acyltransferase family protein [Staphylococcus nepalensis]MBO1216996.1 acyltransferase family protein [Staphylococcus nepalensis]
MAQLKERDFFFDNARMILIFLVVFGHLLQPYTEESKYLSSLYLTIYSFHMPCFLFISGYFAKKAGQAGYLEKVSKKLLVPYFIFFVFFTFYYYFTGKEDSVTFDPFDPVFALWFLLTLFFFHVILVIVKDYKPYYVLPIAIIISLFAGYSDNIDNYLSFSRTIMFFPIFYLGYLFTSNHTLTLRNKKFAPIAMGVLVIFFIIYTIHPINSDWLLGHSPYMSLEGKLDLYSPIKRLLLYFTILITMFSFLNLVPEKERFFTYIGRRTMYVYLLHGIVIGVIRGFGVYPFKEHISVMTYIYLILLTSIIVYVLSTKFISKWTNPVINLQAPSNFKE